MTDRPAKQVICESGVPICTIIESWEFSAGIGESGTRGGGDDISSSVILAGTPGFYLRAQHDPEKKNLIFFFFYFYFNSKGSYQIASIFDMYIIILNGGYMWTKMGPIDRFRL